MQENVFRIGEVYIEHDKGFLTLALAAGGRFLKTTFMYDEILRLTNVFITVSEDYLENVINGMLNTLKYQQQELERMRKGGLSTEEQEKAIRERKERLEELQRVQSLLAKTEGSITELLKARGI